MAQTVHIIHVPCHFGGSRPLFICPGRPRAWRGRYAVKFYSRGSLFPCRRCHDLAYQSQREDTVGRAQLSAAKIRQRLGGSPDWTARFPRKPKGMQQQTYKRLRHRHAEAEQRIENAFVARAARFR